MTWNVSGATLEGTHTQNQRNLYGGGGQVGPGSTITVWGTVRNTTKASNANLTATIGYYLPGRRVLERADDQSRFPPGGSYDYRVSLDIPADATRVTIRVHCGPVGDPHPVVLSFDLSPPQATKPKPAPEAATPTPDPAAPAPNPKDPAPAAPPSAPKEPAQVDRMTLQAGVRRAQPGETVTVPVWLIHGQGVASMNVNLRYDPAVATVAGNIAKGNLLGAALFEANPREPGLIRFGYAQSSDMGGTGTIAQIPFRAAGKPGDRTPLRLEVTTISSAAGNTPDIATIDGEIIIVGKDGVIPGDTDGDGQLTARDAMDALKMSVGNLPVNLAADMDGDGQVTARDATLILQKVVGK